MGLPSLPKALNQTVDAKVTDPPVMTDRSVYFAFQRSLFGTASDPPSSLPLARISPVPHVPLFSLKNEPLPSMFKG